MFAPADPVDTCSGSQVALLSGGILGDSGPYKISKLRVTCRPDAAATMTLQRRYVAMPCRLGPPRHLIFSQVEQLPTTTDGPKSATTANVAMTKALGRAERASSPKCPERPANTILPRCGLKIRSLTAGGTHENTAASDGDATVTVSARRCPNKAARTCKRVHKICSLCFSASLGTSRPRMRTMCAPRLWIQGRLLFPPLFPTDNFIIWRAAPAERVILRVATHPSTSDPWAHCERFIYVHRCAACLHNKRCPRLHKRHTIRQMQIEVGRARAFAVRANVLCRCLASRAPA